MYLIVVAVDVVDVVVVVVNVVDEDNVVMPYFVFLLQMVSDTLETSSTSRNLKPIILQHISIVCL